MRRPRQRALLVLSSLIFIVLLEGLLRLVFPVAEISNFDRIHYSPLVIADMTVHASLANASFSWASDPDGAEFVHHLNLYGFRDRDWDVAADPASLRVAFVGDSMVEGFMASDNETLPSGFVDAAQSRGASIDALNLGVGAANLPEYFQLIRDAVPIFRPDHLFLVIYANDLQPLPFDSAWLEGGSAPVHRSPFTPRLFEVVRTLGTMGRAPLRWSAPPSPFVRPVPNPGNPWSDWEKARKLEGVVNPRIAEAMRQGRFNPYIADSLPGLEALLATPVEVTPHLAALKAYVNRFSSRLWLVYLPTRLQVTDRYLPYMLEYSRPPTVDSFTGEVFQRQAADLRASCAELGIDFLDLTPLLRNDESRGEVLFWNYDDHMRGEAYRRVGRAVYEWWDGRD